MADNKVAFQMRLDETTHKKVKIIADKELRSLNSQLEYFILREVNRYENDYGIISLSE